MKLRKKLPLKITVLSLFLIFILSLAFLSGLYFILNIQYQNQKPKNLFLNGPITMLPKTLRLDLAQPDDDLLTFQSSIIISGQTNPGVSVLVSQDTQDLVIESKGDGSFSTVLVLDEGVNQITVTTFDSTGDSKSAERTVYYSKEKI